MLTLSNPKVPPGLTCNGIPQVNLDQMNPWMMMDPSFCSVELYADMDRGVFVPDGSENGLLAVQDCSGVLNYKLGATKLTHRRLLKGRKWTDWRRSEWKQLDWYKEQGIYGDLVKLILNKTIFRLVWTYNFKVLNQRKKVRCACDGSVRVGQVRMLDHTYIGCVDHTRSRICHALAAAENMMV